MANFDISTTDVERAVCRSLWDECTPKSTPLIGKLEKSWLLIFKNFENPGIHVVVVIKIGYIALARFQLLFGSA